MLSNLFFPPCAFVLENIYKAVLKLYVMWGLTNVFILKFFKTSPKKKLSENLWTSSEIGPELQHSHSFPY